MTVKIGGESEPFVDLRYESCRPAIEIKTFFVRVGIAGEDLEGLFFVLRESCCGEQEREYRVFSRPGKRNIG